MKTKLLTILQIVGTALIVACIFDALAFASWVWSGQHPVDNFYFGTVTAHVLGLVI